MKQVLLRHAGTFHRGKPIWVKPFQHPFHPYVDRKCFQPVQPVEQRTFRHLGAYSHNLHQVGACLFQGEGTRCLQVNGAVRNLLRRV